MSAQENKEAEILPLVRSALTPMDMLDRAITSGAGIEVLTKLMDLQERWDKTQARKAFDDALSAAKTEMPIIVKNRQVDFGAKVSGKSSTNYKHEDLAEVARTIDPILGKHGLSYRFRTTSLPNEPVTVTCIVSHRLGHSEENTLCAGRDDTGNKNSIQALGSTLTYLQRYALKAALGLAASNDDDGMAAGTTLPKKNAKDIYVRLQKEIDEASNRAAFKAWMNDNAESIKTMPEDWQDILRLRAQDKIVQLQNKERGAADTVNAETGEVFADRVIWEEDGERPATAADAPEGLVPDPLDIPEPLKRLTPKQEALWLDLLRSVAAAAPDTQTMMDLQLKHMSPAQQRKVSPTAWLKAVTIFRERVQWLTANPVFDAETWLAGDLAGALSGAETPEQLAKVKDKLLIPERDRLTQDQWRVAVKMYREQLDAIDPQGGLEGW